MAVVPVQCERAFTTTEESYYSLLRRFSVLLESSLSPVLLHIDVVVIANSVREFQDFFLAYRTNSRTGQN